MENYIVPDKVYVLNKNEVLLAVFDKDDEEPIINPQVEKVQNAESVFTFSINPNNPKWLQINDPENLYVVDGKVYSTNFEGCFNEIINESNENLIQVKAYERQKLLSRKYVRAWNSETGFEKIDSFMVVILSNGNLPLKNNGITVSTTHTIGTSGYVLDALLYGTGWTTGTCDVEGTFDFETDQVDIYENILKVQQIWGGILVFDSINKTVSHRDESTWLPYNGYEVKYQKNMQSLEKLYNNKIITKLCPLGEGGLNIASVNSNSIWLTNTSYTNTVLEGIENNPDIYDAAQLKRWGQRKLQDLCKPRTELTVKAALLYQVEGYELERVDLNDIVDVINFGDTASDVVQLRVVGFIYNLWDYSDAVLELSDITLDSTDIFKKNVQAANQINAGTLNTTQVVSFFRAGESVEKTLRDINNAVAEIIIYEDSIVSTVKNGGLNLLLNTNNTEWKAVSCSKYAGASVALGTYTDIADLGLSVGDTITYSLYIKTTSGKKIRARISYYDSSSTAISSSYATDEYIVQNDEGYSYATGIIPENCKYIILWIDANLTASTITETTTEYIKAEKLEKGAIPTTWTPSILDYSTSTQVVQTATSITSTAIAQLESDTSNLIINSIDKGINHLNSETGSRREYGFINMGQSYMNVTSGTTVTISFDLEMQVNTANPYIQIYNSNNKGPKQFSTQTLYLTGQVGTTIKGRYSVTSTIVDRNDANKTDNYIEFYSVYDTSNWFKVTNIKLELGSTATPWSPGLKEFSTSMSQTARAISLTATEKSSGTACGITIQLKTPGGENLATGLADITLSGMVKFTDLSTSGNTTINGGNITTGIIKSANYVSGTSGTSINLSTGVIDTKGFKVDANGAITSTSGIIGGFTLGTNVFSANLTSKRITTYTYTNSDKTRLQQIILGNITPTTSDYNKYDFDEDGDFSSVDLLILQRILNGTEDGQAIFTLDTKNSEGAILLKRPSGTEIARIGIFTSYFSRIVTNSMENLGNIYLYQNNIEESPIISLNHSDGKVKCVSLEQTSLAKSKKNFTKLGNALDIIKNIDIYKYNFKEEEDTIKKHIGFVIGDKYKYSQEITSNENDGVDIYSFVSVCCKAIQELQAEIEELKNSKK